MIETVLAGRDGGSVQVVAICVVVVVVVDVLVVCST